jgi:hypothetical protein
MRNTKDKKNDAQKPKKESKEDQLKVAVEEYKVQVTRSFPRKLNDEEL